MPGLKYFGNRNCGPRIPLVVGAFEDLPTKEIRSLLLAQSYRYGYFVLDNQTVVR